MLEQSLRALIDAIREDGKTEGVHPLPYRKGGLIPPALRISLPRFQSYRGRTEAALVQELTDFVEEYNLSLLYYQVDDGLVELW